MSLLEDVLGKLGTGGDQQKLLETVMGLVNDSKTGGLAGFVRLFQEKGLGDAAASWVSTGQNLPISAAGIQQALGDERIRALEPRLLAGKALRWPGGAHSAGGRPTRAGGLDSGGLGARAGARAREAGLLQGLTGSPRSKLGER